MHLRWAWHVGVISKETPKLLHAIGSGGLAPMSAPSEKALLQGRHYSSDLAVPV